MRKWIDLFEVTEVRIEDYNPDYFENVVEVEFVCINPSVGGSDPEAVARLYDALKSLNEITLYREDFVEEAGHWAMCAVIDKDRVHEVKALADQHGVEIDLVKTFVGGLTAEHEVIDVWTNVDGAVRYQRNEELPLPPTTMAAARALSKSSRADSS